MKHLKTRKTGALGRPFGKTGSLLRGFYCGETINPEPE